ncbi:MAG TPA: hypothetical protein PLP19_22160 [bacterium]|nr:hypothetical protein [bacterium]HPN46205.1 hypothetical protein [bacterium]
MAGYESLPPDWRNELERKAGIHLMPELVFDPEGKNVMLNGKYGISAISGLAQTLDMDVTWERRPTMREVVVTLRDPDGRLNPGNPASPFHDAVSELLETTPRNSHTLRLAPQQQVAFSNGEAVTIKGPAVGSGGIVQQTCHVSGFEKQEEFDLLTLQEATSFDFAAGCIVYVNALENSQVLIRLRTDNTANPVTLFRGRLLKTPEAGSGYITLTLVELQKNTLDLSLTGVDRDADKKLMRINSNGELASSIQWSEGADGTLNRSLVYPLANCRPGNWELEFISDNEYIVSGPGVDGLHCDTRYGYSGRLAGVENDMGFAWHLIKDLNYLYIPVIDTGKLVIADAVDPAAPVKVSSIAFADFPSYADVAKNGNYVFVAYVDMGAGFTGALKCYHVADKYNPVLVDTKTAGQEGVPEDFFCYSCKVYGNRLFVQGYDTIYIFNISNPANIVYVAQIGGSGSPWYMQGLWNFCIAGQYLYTASYFDRRFLIINITNPDSPTLAGSLSLDYGGSDVAVSGNYAYIKTGDGRITIVNIANPASPVLAGSFGGPGAPYYTDGYGLQVSDGFLYTTSMNDGALSLFDLAEPDSPAHFEAISGAGEPHYLANATGLAVSNGYVFLVAEGGVTVYRISTVITNNQGGTQLRIIPAAWGGHPHAGEIVRFTTALSWQQENPARILYELLSRSAAIPAHLLAASAFFGDKHIGVLAEALETADTEVKVTVTVPTLIKAGAGLKIGAYMVSVNGGNTAETSYPPQISLTIAAHTGADIPAGTAVIVQQQEATDADYNFDREYGYCETANICVSLSLDRDMSILQALQTVCALFDGFLYTDNWGVEQIYTIRPQLKTPVLITGQTNLLPNPEILTRPMINEFTVRYCYDYENSRYLVKCTFPESINTNKSYRRHGFIRGAVLSLPGFYRKQTALAVIDKKYELWQYGIKMVAFQTSLQGLLLNIGDRVHLHSESPALDLDVELIGRQVTFREGLDIRLIGLVAPAAGGAQ